MAYGLKQISPLDLRPSTAIGVKIPFSSKSAFTSVYTTKEQTKYNLINFMLTDPRETPMIQNFGAGLRSFIFEQIAVRDLESLQLSIATKIENNFPNVEVVNLVVTGQPETNSVVIDFSYRLRNSNENDTVIVQIQNM
jgi:hypothetical protein